MSIFFLALNGMSREKFNENRSDMKGTMVCSMKNVDGMNSENSEIKKKIQ